METLSNLKKIKCGKIKENVDLSMYTTYKIKATGKYMVYPNDIDDLLNLMKFITKHNLKYKIIGGGSNLVFENEVYDGILIHLDKFDDIEFKDTKIRVGAGYSLMKAAMKACRLGLTGLEFATGIPGTIGGAIYNNSGAYKSDMGYVVESVSVLTPDLKIKTLYNRDLDFHYRTSFFKNHSGYIILDATIVLKHGDKESIKEVVEDRKQRRLMSQPLNYPSAGSVFRNPEGNYAGKLIEDIGYKGYEIGGAKVSEKHANFIINYGSATGHDIVALIDEIKAKVKEEYNIELVVEQEIVK